MFGAALLVALREGLEISLILGIIFSYLKRSGRRDAFKYAWWGSGAALGIATAVGSVLYVLTGDEEWSGQAVLEVIVFALAVAILSYMTFWMKKNSRGMGRALEGKLDTALRSGGVWSFVVLAFATVIREGLELVMFLLALSVQGHEAAPVSGGAIVGLMIAVAIGWGVYRGTSRINLKVFFQAMGNVLIVVAAGLAANGVHSAIEAGLLPPGSYVYDWGNVLNADSAIGGVLHALVGYSDHPSVLQVGAWLLYLIAALVLFNRSGVRSRLKTAPR